AGLTGECVNDDAGVVGNRRHPRQPEEVTRLGESILAERVERLDILLFRPRCDARSDEVDELVYLPMNTERPAEYGPDLLERVAAARGAGRAPRHQSPIALRRAPS